MEDDPYSNWTTNATIDSRHANKTVLQLSPSEKKNHNFYKKPYHPYHSNRFADLDDFHESFYFPTNNYNRRRIKSPYHSDRRQKLLADNRSNCQLQQEQQCQQPSFDNTQPTLSKCYHSEPMFDSLPSRSRSPFKYHNLSIFEPRDKFESWNRSESGRVRGSSYKQPYVPPNAHVPIERYVPKTEPYRVDYSYSLSQMATRNSSLPSKYSEKQTQCNLMKQSIIVSFANDNKSTILMPKNATKAEFVYDNDQITAICWKPGQCTESPLKQTLKTYNDSSNDNRSATGCPVKRTVSEPSTSSCSQPVAYSQQNPHTFLTQSHSDMLSDRPKILGRTNSKTEAIKNYIKKETTNFFGIDSETENEQQILWLEKRKRFASRKYGPLKFDFRLSQAEIDCDQLDHTLNDIEMVSGVADNASSADMLPDILPVAMNDEIQGSGDKTFAEKCSFTRLTLIGLSFVISAVMRGKRKKHFENNEPSRSFNPKLIPTDTNVSDSTFFETTSMYLDSQQFDQTDSSTNAASSNTPSHRNRTYSDTKKLTWQRIPKKTLMDQRKLQVGGNRILSSIIDRVEDNSNRRQYGKGWVSTIFRRSFKRSVVNEEHVRKQLNDLEDHRPFFTYWITTVQILVLFISLFSYGFGPFGINMSKKSGHVLVNSLSLQQVDFQEPSNFWIGPRAADLIHLGAKFSPCMRLDSKINYEIMVSRKGERETACCIRNDDSGCVQAYRNDCSFILSHWQKWQAPFDTRTGNRISGSVCGLDPKYCDAPASIHPYEWPDDITKWPICRKNSLSIQQQNFQIRDKAAEHMMCEVIGRPCCIGIHGLCQITTKEYCDFVNGHLHEEASLCSQVSCLNDVCGLIPFYNADVPDQLYRLISSIFLHAGIVHLLITVLVQHYLMRDVERLTGSLRLAIIYFGSGIAGNLASAVFLPYRADVGPSGSQFGLLACLIVEVMHAWPMLRYPKSALVKLLIISLVLLFLGTLPWIDNYAHLFGFFSGFLLSYAFLPFITFGKYDRRKKVILITICLLIATMVFIILLAVFYFFPIHNCSLCSYLNCLPITRDFCASQNIDIIFQQMRI